MSDSPGSAPSNPESPPPSFEAALEQLEAIVDDLEEGRLGLEPSLVRFEEGVRLLRNCYGILETAERRIEVLTGFSGDGTPQTAPFDSQATFEETSPPAAKSARKRSTGKQASSSGEDPATDDDGTRRLF